MEPRELLYVFHDTWREMFRDSIELTDSEIEAVLKEMGKTYADK